MKKMIYNNESQEGMICALTMKLMKQTLRDYFNYYSVRQTNEWLGSEDNKAIQFRWGCVQVFMNFNWQTRFQIAHKQGAFHVNTN